MYCMLTSPTSPAVIKLMAVFPVLKWQVILWHWLDYSKTRWLPLCWKFTKKEMNKIPVLLSIDLASEIYIYCLGKNMQCFAGHDLHPKFGLHYNCTWPQLGRFPGRLRPLSSQNIRADRAGRSRRLKGVILRAISRLNKGTWKVAHF